MPRTQTTTTPVTNQKRTKASAPAPAQTPAFDDAPPMRQRRGAFYALLAIFVVWIVVLLVMYFTTVRSHGGRLVPLPTTGDVK